MSLFHLASHDIIHHYHQPHLLNVIDMSLLGRPLIKNLVVFTITTIVVETTSHYRVNMYSNRTNFCSRKAAAMTKMYHYCDDVTSL